MQSMVIAFNDDMVQVFLSPETRALLDERQAAHVEALVNLLRAGGKPDPTLARTPYAPLNASMPAKWAVSEQSIHSNKGVSQFALVATAPVEEPPPLLYMSRHWVPGANNVQPGRGKPAVPPIALGVRPAPVVEAAPVLSEAQQKVLAARWVLFTVEAVAPGTQLNL